MLRLSRPLTLALLWLAIALLPLRVWAAAVMPVGMAAQAIAAEPAPMADDAAPHGHHPAALPCHGALAVPDAQGATDSAEHAGCSLCAVCHGAAAPMAGQAPALPQLPEARPRDEAGPGIERPVQSGPERPPRIAHR
jgi:hypothetical protein